MVHWTLNVRTKKYTMTDRTWTIGVIQECVSYGRMQASSSESCIIAISFRDPHENATNTSPTLYAALRVDAVPLGFQLLVTCVADTRDIETESQNPQHHVALRRFVPIKIPILPPLSPVTSFRDLYRSKQWDSRDIEMFSAIRYSNVEQ